MRLRTLDFLRKLVRVAFPWHLGTRRLTAHRPLGVEASCFEPQTNEARRASRMDLKGCFQPDGRDQETGSDAVGSPPLKTRRVHAPRRNRPPRGRPRSVKIECFTLDSRIRSERVRENRSPTILKGIFSPKSRLSGLKARIFNLSKRCLAHLLMKSSTEPL